MLLVTDTAAVQKVQFHTPQLNTDMDKKERKKQKEGSAQLAVRASWVTSASGGGKQGKVHENKSVSFAPPPPLLPFPGHRPSPQSDGRPRSPATNLTPSVPCGTCGYAENVASPITDHQHA